MASTIRTQILLISTALAAGIGLWFADKKGPEKKEAATKTTQAPPQALNVDWNKFADSVMSSLQADSKNKTDLDYYNLIGQGKASMEQFDSLSYSLLRLKQPLAAAVILSKKAEKSGTASDWSVAAESFYRASHFTSGAFASPALRASVEGFKKASGLEPGNLRYKTQLGSAIVESGANPMEGITLLREVVSTDSTYIDAHIQLALFAIQSGQFDKAISRLQKVLIMRPDFSVAYLYLGQAFQQSGKIPEAIRSLEKYRDELNDPALRNEVQQYIEQLKKPNNS